jgi:hypothetical protein
VQPRRLECWPVWRLHRCLQSGTRYSPQTRLSRAARALAAVGRLLLLLLLLLLLHACGSLRRWRG